MIKSRYTRIRCALRIANMIVMLFIIAISTAEGHPEAYLFIQEWDMARSTNDSIYRGIHTVQSNYSIIVGNTDDDSNTVLKNVLFSIDADNVIGIDDDNINYANIDGSSIKWIFPSEEQIYEKKNFHSEIYTNIYKPIDIPMDINRWTNKSLFNSDGDVFQLVKFNVTFYDSRDIWGQIEARDINRSKYRLNATILPDTFSTDAPLSILNNNESGINFNFGKIILGKTYHFSVVIKLNIVNNDSIPISSFEYKPAFRTTYQTCKFRIGEINYATSMPSDMLPDNFRYASASTNILNQWSQSFCNLKGMYIDRSITVTSQQGNILEYYRGLGMNPNIVETDDLLKAADDWRINIVPSGFSVSISTNELLTLADEWRNS